MEKKRAIFKKSVQRIVSDSMKRHKDSLVAEEPFTLVWQSIDRVSERLASTMRTPGDDLALAAGMLFSEGAVRSKNEIRTLSFCAGGGVNELNRLKAELLLSSTTVSERLGHRPSASLPQSACGLCAVDDLSVPSVLLDWAASRFQGSPSEPDLALLHRALGYLEDSCPLFKTTGASHASILISHDGELLRAAEDVGRHNACDKAIGGLLLASERDEPFQLPPRSGLLVSSRFSFELAQKGIAAGASWMASVGAPTHLAVEVAERCGVPLFGFLSRKRHNRYV